jgi:uncharacterized repeat protein (TIGR03803 family)
MPATGGTLGKALLIFTAFSAARAASPTLTTLYNFTGGSDGFFPLAGVVIGSGGVLYGTTYSLGFGKSTNTGTAFSLTPPASAGGTWTQATIQEFTGDNGLYPGGILAIGGGGVLYGTCSAGGAGGTLYGTAFSLTPPASPGGGWIGAVLYSFASGYGHEPVAGIAIGIGGVLYGTTSSYATVYALVPPASSGGAWTEHDVHTFTPSLATNPEGGVVIGKDGVLYGTTGLGGGGGSDCSPHGCGTVFSLTPSATPGGAWTETVLHSFTDDGGSDGAYPDAGVVIDGSGVLYGTTQGGGTTGYGTVFSLTPPSSPGGAWTETILYNFSGGSDGAHPVASVAVGRGGVLYGTTPGGGTGYGVVFSLSPPVSRGSPWTETVLHAFSGADGSGPMAPVAIGSDGALYGTTKYGGTYPCGALSNGCGTVFSLAP